jgi:hypothetical protein
VVWCTSSGIIGRLDAAVLTVVVVFVLGASYLLYEREYCTASGYPFDA